MQGKRSGFTLVELIVVIVILGVLSTIGFVSYNGYLAGARDSNRVTQLKNINDSLTLYSADKDLPLPDDYVTVMAGTNVVGFQGYAGQNTLELINYTSGGKDPKDDQYFTYFLSKDKKKVQLLAFLEETDNLQTSVPFIGQTYAAADYTNRFPKVYGKKLGVLTLTANKKPIQEIGAISSAGELDISVTAETYTAHLSDTETIEGTAAQLTNMTSDSSCKRIKETGGSIGNGTYEINPEANGTAFEVYCDMEVGGGGWTHIGSKIDGTSNQTVGNLGTVVTEPSKPANVHIPQLNFRVALTEAMACSTNNCWVWDLDSDFRTRLGAGSTTAFTGKSITVKRVSGSTGVQSFTATSFWYDANSGTPSAMFDIQGGANGLGASTTRWSMDGTSGGGAWITGDQWDIYVR